MVRTEFGGDGDPRDARILQDRSRLLDILKGGRIDEAAAERWATQRVSA